MSDHDHDGGLARDLPLLTRRRLVAGLGLVGAAGAGAWFLAGSGGMAEGNLWGTASDGSQCLKLPGETAGPFPADGTNRIAGQTANVLTQSGVVRDDIRTSFGGLTGVAEGAPLNLDLTLVSVDAGCAPLEGHTIYLWHCDADGKYSLYDLPAQNFLRGVAVTDAKGRARITSILPGCYPGRWPHIHFEVFASLDAAVSGKAALLTSQFAFAAADLASAYAAPRYAASAGHLAGLSLAGDMIFASNTAEQVAAQTLLLSTSAAGFRATAQVGIAG